MGWFNRFTGYPDGDPSGRDRSLFRKIGSKAADAFIARANPKEASDIIEAWTSSIVRQVGEYHPDIGRASLLMSVFMTMTARYEMALQLAATAIELLRPLGPNDYDFRAAAFLEDKLKDVIAGTFDKSGPAIIQRG